MPQDGVDLFRPSMNGWNGFPLAAACHAAATDPGGTGRYLGAGNVVDPGAFARTGRGVRGGYGCPNYSSVGES